jgi:hypothetical protein
LKEDVDDAKELLHEEVLSDVVAALELRSRKDGKERE